MTTEDATNDTTKVTASPIPTDQLLELMYRLAQAYLASGEQTAQVELVLRRMASAYGMRRSRVVAFPTAVFISVHDGDDERVTLAEGPLQTLRLDQIAAVYALGLDAQRAEMSPREGLDRLSEILRRSPRFGAIGSVIGHTILAVGVALVLMPSLTNIAAAAGLGLLVGIVKLLDRERALLAVPTPVIMAALTSALVFLAVANGLPVDPLHALVPPLVTFLPGAMLTLGMVELVYGDMVSGSSRLITGFVQLVLLAFGLAAGAALVGYSPEHLMDAKAVHIPSWWKTLAPWVGAMVFGVGAYVHFSAPPRSLGWLLVVVLTAFAAQRVAASAFGSEISGFFGTLVATPLAYLIQLRFNGPPATVTFLPSFWLLVPGSLGLLGVTHMMSDRQRGLDSLVTVVFALASIALGTLVGATFYKSLTERFGRWQLQMGRVGSRRERRNRQRGSASRRSRTEPSESARPE